MANNPNNMENLRNWKPGQSGNPKGRLKQKPMTDALKALMDKDDGAAIKVLIQKAYDEAKGGDFRYFKEIMDRIDGKVIEQIELNADVNVQELPGLTAKDLTKLGEGHDGPE